MEEQINEKKKKHNNITKLTLMFCPHSKTLTISKKSQRGPKHFIVQCTTKLKKIFSARGVLPTSNFFEL